MVVTLRYRRFRLLVSLAGGAVLASAVLIGIIHLAGGERPRALAAGAGQWSWLTGASLVGPALLAAAVAGTVAAAPWLSRPWRRAAWIALWLAAVARLVTGTASPMEVVVAFAAGVTVGAGVLVLFGVPDRRIGPDGIAAALASAGLPVARVEPAAVEAKGSRPFIAAAEDGEPLFIKVLGSDQRDADLLYRAYRFIRLRDVGDTRPAASLIQAVEHQALAAVMAERAGVAVPAVRQVIKTADGSALLAMERVDGSSLDRIPVQAHQRHDAPGAVETGGWAAPGENRAPLAAGGQHRGRPYWPALDRRLQLLRTGRHAAPDGARRRRAAGLAGCHRSGPTERSPARLRSSARTASRRRCRCCSRLLFRPAPAARSPARTAC